MRQPWKHALIIKMFDCKMGWLYGPYEETQTEMAIEGQSNPYRHRLRLFHCEILILG